MLNWAIYGTGFISHQTITAIAASDGSRVHTIIGRNPETLAQLQSQYAIPHAASDPTEAFQNPDIDAVYIALPNHIHHTATIAASDAGKAVLCEKSLTVAMEQAHELAQTIRTNKTFFVEGLMYLAHPLYQTLIEILRDGRLGKLRAIHGHYAADINAVTNPLGGGTLYNLGCYPVSLMHLVVQTMCGPEAFNNRTLHGTGIIDPDNGTFVDAAVSVKFGDSVLATLQSTDTYGMTHDFAISGENGILRFVSNPWLPETENHLQWCPHNGARQDIYINVNQNAFYYQVKLVETALANAQIDVARPSPTLADSLEIMQFLTDWEAACA